MRRFDVYAPYAFLGIGTIRVGNSLNGTALGKPTALPLGVSFPKGSLGNKLYLLPG